MRPQVHACSGCSSTAQMAHHLAVRLGRDGHAEMSCIAGEFGAGADREVPHGAAAHPLG